MAANTDKFRHGASGISTTLQSSISNSDLAFTPASVSNIPTITAVDITVDRVDSSGTLTPSKLERMIGVVSGGNLVSLLRGQDNTSAQSHSTGAVIEMIPTGKWSQDLITGLLTQHNQDGSHGAITATSISDNGTTLSAVRSEVISNFVASGGIIAISSGLIGTFSNIVYYISGYRYTASSIANKTYTVSKDTYVDINSSGVPTYTEVANGATAPVLSAGYLRLAIVITNGSAITSIRQNGYDSLNNRIAQSSSVLPRQDAIWWEELGRTTLSSSAASVSLSSLPVRKYLKVLIKYTTTGGTNDAGLRYNNDSGSNYATRYANPGSAAATDINQIFSILSGATTLQPTFVDLEFLNNTTEEKMGWGTKQDIGGTGSGTSPGVLQVYYKWSNTVDPITRIDLVKLTGAGLFNTGSEIIVLGHN